jgi:hypothetical protein
MSIAALVPKSETRKIMQNRIQIALVALSLTLVMSGWTDETFYLELSNVANGLLGKPRGRCTITEVRIAGISLDTTVIFNTVLGRRYVVERTSNTIDWEVIPGATNVPGTGELVSILDRGSGCQGMRAYRARLLIE